MFSPADRLADGKFRQKSALATDDQGTVLSITDSTGTQQASYTYDEYGKQTATTGTLTNPWRYTSGYNDGNGLTKYGTRYYDPTTGRWTQQDPINAAITNPNAANRYPYVGDNPTNITDSSGRGWFDTVTNVAGKVLGTITGCRAAMAFTPVLVAAAAFAEITVTFAAAAVITCLVGGVLGYEGVPL